MARDWLREVLMGRFEFGPFNVLFLYWIKYRFMVDKQLVKQTLNQLKMAELRQLGREYGLEVELTRDEIIKKLLYPRLLRGGGKAMEDLPEPALEKILSRLSQAEIRQLRIASPKFHERLKTLEEKAPYFKELIASRPRIGEPRIIRGHTDWVLSVAWSPDGSRLASGSDDMTIRIWDSESGQSIGEPLRGHTNWVWSVAWSPDGSRLASGSSDRTIRIWDSESGHSIGEPLRGHTDWVRSVAWSPDGSRLASGSYDRTIRIWDSESGQSIGEPLSGHTDWVLSVAWSPDGSRLASGSGDGTIRIWDSESGQSIGEPLRSY